MGESNENLLKAIRQYQESLDKYTPNRNNAKLLYYLDKLYKLPIKVAHLEETGVGRTVNALRKLGGDVGDAAKSLVAKWKEMVVEEEDKTEDTSGELQEHEESSANTTYSSDNNEEKELMVREKESSSSRRESDKNRKEKHSSKSDKKESSHQSGGKHRHKERKYQESSTKKHKADKRRRDSSSSDIEEEEKPPVKRRSYEISSDSEDEIEERKTKKKSKHRHNGDSSSEVEEYKIHKSKKAKKSTQDNDENKNSSDEERKQKLKKSKRKEEESDKHKSKHKKHDLDVEESKPKNFMELDEASPKSSKHDKSKSSPEKTNKKETKHTREETPKEKPRKDEQKKLVEVKKPSSKESSGKKEKSSSRSKSEEKSSSKHKSSDKKEKSKSSKNGAPKVLISSIDSESGASFAEALGMCAPAIIKSSTNNTKKIKSSTTEKISEKLGQSSKISSSTRSSSPPILLSTSSSSSSTFQEKPPKIVDDVVPKLLREPTLDPLDINISTLLPTITPNYRPLGLPMDLQQRRIMDDEALSKVIYSKNQRTKVYSGNKVLWNKVPTLFEICTRILQDNIDALEYTGGVPYSILKPILEKANPDQLYMMEHHNPYLIEDTDELWQLHCGKEFRNKRRDEMESWREMYMRCLDEREAKLKALTANIKQSQDKSLPVRTTKLAYVDDVAKPPRNVARKQARNGTAFDKKPAQTPSSRLSAIATSGEAGKVAVPNPGSRAMDRSGGSHAVIKVKKAPLMAKTLLLLKNRFRR